MVDKSFRLNLFTISTLLTSMTSSYDRLSILPIDANRRYSVLSMWFRDGIPVERLPYDGVWLSFGNWLNKMKNELSQGLWITLGDFCQPTPVGKQMGGHSVQNPLESRNVGMLLSTEMPAIVNTTTLLVFLTASTAVCQFCEVMRFFL